MAGGALPSAFERVVEAVHRKGVKQHRGSQGYVRLILRLTQASGARHFPQLKKVLQRRESQTGSTQVHVAYRCCQP